MVFGVVGRDAVDQIAIVRFARREHVLGALVIVARLPHVEPQIGLAMGRVVAVAMKTLVSQNRPNVVREVDFLLGSRCQAQPAGCCHGAQRQDHDDPRDAVAAESHGLFLVPDQAAPTGGSRRTGDSYRGELLLLNRVATTWRSA